MRRCYNILLSATLLCSMATPSYALRVAAPLPDLSASDVPALIEQLKSEDMKLQSDALNDLWRVKPLSAAKDALPALIAITKHKKRSAKDWNNGYLKARAIGLLGSLPKTPETVDILFSTADITYSPPECRAKDDSLSHTISCMEYTQVSSAAANSLPMEEAYIGRIKQALKHPNSQVRDAIVGRFRLFGKLPKGAGEMLKTLVASDPDRFVRTTAAQVIAEKGKNDASYAPALIIAIMNENGNFNKLFYVTALVETGGVTEDELPLFIDLLATNENASTRYNSAKIIGQLGPKAADAVPSLITAMRSDTNPLVRAYAVEALGKVATKDATQALIHALSDENPEIQKLALHALQQQGNTSPEVQALAKKLSATANR